MRRVCVFCGSSPGRDARYAAAAADLARGLVARGIGVVFGGGSVGLMG
ncbi:MAG TPA: TIGR00730 family Rossman fold protein, partial [Vicinamibacteria bacterium]|nr:TIGR00730 family Rossman fold protein [Vicinamibacteria bacterium]